MPPILSRRARNRRLCAVAARLQRWFSRHQRALPWRQTYSAYHIWISEVMLQQTRMEVVLPYFQRFLQRFPDVRSLAGASETAVLSVWSGLGYYRRARMLHQGAKVVVESYHGRIPADREKLLAIPGVGPYTAGAIASIAFDEPAPIVDGNVARVLARLEAIRERPGSARFRSRMWELAGLLVNSGGSPRALNQSLMELGALICLPRHPRCGECPIAAMCAARALGEQERFPRRIASKNTAFLEIPLYVVVDQRGKILMRRERGALMNEMLHLPHGNGLLFGSSRSLFQPRRYLGSFRHTVTHRRIRFNVWSASGRSRGGFTWIDPATLDHLPHPSYVRKALSFL